MLASPCRSLSHWLRLCPAAVSQSSGLGSPGKGFVKCNFPAERWLDFLSVFLSVKGTGMLKDRCQGPGNLGSREGLCLPQPGEIGLFAEMAA